MELRYLIFLVAYLFLVFSFLLLQFFELGFLLLDFAVLSRLFSHFGFNMT